ncbi:MAG: NAD(P)-dependent alcohol dehydrogenase [Gammaproteobacteria bacterium]|nr:NAD(P)-dependent alcohol dehydrogenase [Gammaproteobacteria bacterium]
MKAIVFTRYGSPDVLALKEVEKPIPKDDEALVRICAASINSWDWELLRGKPFVNRVIFGLLKPKFRILGADIAGRIEAVGKNVTQFQPGDEVFGDQWVKWGGFAEYVCARESVLVPKPAGLTFEQAAAVPQAGVLAVQGLRDKGQIQPGQTVLINGAGGGVGTFAVQIAKSAGAEVTGVDSAGKLDMLRSIGADHVIDYTQEDFTRNGRRYDLILDVIGLRSAFDFKRALAPEGRYVMVGGSTSRILQALLLGLWSSMVGSQKMGLLAMKPSRKDLGYLKELLEAGKVVPVIDRRYPLSEVPDAYRHFGAGHHKGKVIITLE